MGEFGTVRRRVQKLQVQWKTFEVQHFFSEPACNRSIVPPVHFTLCPKLDIHSTDLSYTLQKVAKTPWKVTERSGAFLSSHQGRHRRRFPSSNSSGHNKRTAILLLLTRLWRWMTKYAISTRIVLNIGLSLAISTITDREINEL
jgi:hypothetical protein